MVKLVLMRHGESSADLEPIRVEGQADFPLTDRGLSQVALLGQRIAQEYRLDQLIASPLTRAVQTAQAIANTTDLSLQTDPLLMERSFGIFGGMTRPEVLQRCEGRLLPWDLPLHEPAEGGESFLQHHHRVAQFWHALHSGEDNRTVGVVCHGGTIQILYHLALGLPVQHKYVFASGDTCVHEWEFEPGGDVHILLSNCTRHLR